MAIGTYTFLPWLRQGIANNIQTADMDASVKTRASVAVSLNIKGSGGEGGDITAPVVKNVALYGPGDIIGIESRAIIKTEPLNWITNFEPNYLCHIEFYDEDFPWRYTPATPSGSRLRPWVTLIVLTEAEFSDGGNISGKPLPFIEIKPDALESVFPKAEELWAWAHVHVNKNIAGNQDAPQAPNMDSVLAQFQNLLAQNPDEAYSRIVCPRKLAPNERYHAFLIPTFETGRLAGLGMNPDDAPHATFSAWGEGRPAPTQFPIYYRWFFRTGSQGDFEYLVRLLEPKPADSRVGRRDMDVQNPGSNISGIQNPDLEGVLKLSGALLAPLSNEAEQEIAKWENWDQPYPHIFQQELAAFLNLADDYARLSADSANQNTNLPAEIQADPDPIITPPIYGRWHALRNRVLKEGDGSDSPNNDNWLHELNLDPRWRSAAGFGTDVIIANQEEYMDAAWDQVGDVLEANRQIRLAQLAQITANSWYQKQVLPLQQISHDKILFMTAPVQKRVVSQGMTVFHQIKQSPVTPALTSASLRRMLRPNGRLQKLSYFDERIHPNNLISRVNEGIVTAAPPHVVPESLPTFDKLAEDAQPDGVPDWLLNLLKQYPFIPNLLLFLILLLVIFLLVTGANPGIGVVAVLVSAGLIWAYRTARRLIAQAQQADSVSETNQTPATVDAMPPSNDFVLTPELNLLALDPANPPQPATVGTIDNIQSNRFKTALKDSYTVLQNGLQAGVIPVSIPINVALLATNTLVALNPATTIPKWTLGKILLPAHILKLIGEKFVEAMAYPEFDIPMYKPLVDKSTELFVPNLNFIEQNSITLLKTNQPFIESYLVGLNHEFSRELLWREYPTDQRGSYFRQFWDISSYLSRTEDSEQRREELRDIPPIHRWSKFSKLGEHDHREQGLENEEELVLVIRGELLKKYPNAVIYAQKAKWQPISDTNPAPNKKTERIFDEGVPIKTPLYEAQVKPDIYFFGFDLTEEEARGNDKVDDEPGWFFVIKERPGEPRFGLDIDREGPVQVWNDLSWPDVVPGLTDGDFIDIASAPNRSLPNAAPSGTAQEKAEQWQEDHLLNWTENINSAELAYILFQAPVLVGVHASEMLPD
ncbi:hypothetical protein [Nitrosomonas sp.]|uniref:hypothetical protein n=1 Tax=Nitrosomonas sp. TaxID=42353 RepID=UPI0027322042|nr:hypothetical protein [Nitrosomonas sp.]MDP1786528.1 hypothetical protein [Nitrosomonas sp.]MDP2223961.1 hypothetical protein [Nitrosomonas sp.]